MGALRPKILFILHMPPPVHGAAIMGKYIHDSQLINSTFECHYINLTTASSLEDIGKGGLKKLWRFIKLLRQIKSEIKRLNPNIVYITPNATAPAFYKDFIVVQVLKSLGCKVVAHYHNKGVSRKQNLWLDNKLYHTFFINLKVILLADTLYKDIAKYVKQEDVLICPNGIPEILTEEPKANCHNQMPHLLFLSNLLESKGIIVLLDACKILAEKDYPFVCDIVGGETAEIDRNRFAKEVEIRGLEGKVIYHGKKYGEDKEEFWKKADIFVFPTANECFPLVLLEAMQHGVAVVSTKEGGIQAIINEGENGYLIEKNNPSKLADVITSMINNPAQTSAMGLNGYKKYNRDFTLKAFEKKFTDCILSINEQ